MHRVASLGVVLLIAAPMARADDAVPADVARYELGRRLKQFEHRWERTTDPAARKRAVAELEKVHPQFLSLRFAEAARTLDRATHALRSEKPMTADEGWVAGLVTVPEKRLLGTAEKQVTVTVRLLYPVAGKPSDRRRVVIGSGKERVAGPDPDALPGAVALPLGPADRADDRLVRLVDVSAVSGEASGGWQFWLGRVADPAGRVKRLKAAAAGWKAFDTIEQATVRDRADLLTDLLAGETPETDLPAGPLLAEAEAMLDGKPHFTAARTGGLRLSVPLGGKKTAPVRVFVPFPLDPKKPVPVVVGLHGAGGTENLFFEGYGAGSAVKECDNRKWIFVAPRGGLDFLGAPPVAEVLDQLARRYPIDPKRVFLVGHSMGAGQAVRLAQQHPGRFAAVAALGGGGRVTDPKAFAELPVFVAAGDKDFGLGMARALNRSLAGAGVRKVTYKEYPDAEHLLIVREALPDVFALFDRVANAP